MSPKVAGQILEVLENEMESAPSRMEYQFAYQARIAMDRIRFAIKEAEKFSRDFDQMREAAFQLVDALDRLASADREFQKRFRDRSSGGNDASCLDRRKGS